MPPHLLKKLLESKHEDVRQTAFNTMLVTARLRGERSVRGFALGAAAHGNARRTVFDCHKETSLSSATTARSEDSAESSDPSVNRAFDGFGKTRDFYKQIFNRNSIDDRGMRLDGYVHRGIRFNNAFWDGQQMIFGDGDGRFLTDLTKSLDVIAHELTHGVTEHTAGLEYHNQSGALNESMSDVFGSLVKQWSLGQTADQADWLIGAEVFTPQLQGDALRSLKDPGNAYNNPDFGKDPQPGHMNDYVQLPDNEDGDNGGVHINSGIPNKAFYLAATGIGGPAWDAAGHIWYESLKASGVTTNFQQFADTTFAKADQLYGAGSAQQQVVLLAWREVGVSISGIPARAMVSPPASAAGADDWAAVKAQLQELSIQIKTLSGEVAALGKQKQNDGRRGKR